VNEVNVADRAIAIFPPAISIVTRASSCCPPLHGSFAEAQ
jgi:hypothetical protein